MGNRTIDHYMWFRKEEIQRVNIELRRERLERRLKEEKCKENNEESIDLIVRALRVIDCCHKLL